MEGIKDIILCIALLALLSTVCAAKTYQLGSHNVSMNLSIPANYNIETPIYISNTDSWWYILNITPSSGGTIIIMVGELNIPLYGSQYTQRIAQGYIQNISNEGVGGYKYKITNYKGHDAFEQYIPEQRVGETGRLVPEVYRIDYQLDERTLVEVTARETGEKPYNEVLDLLNIVCSPESISHLL